MVLRRPPGGQAAWGWAVDAKIIYSSRRERVNMVGIGIGIGSGQREE